MDFISEITNGIKEAMKAKDKVRLEALRAIKKELLEAQTAKDAGEELNDDIVMKIIQKMVKQRKDSAGIFKGQGREDLAEKELNEAAVVAEFLPEQMTGEALEAAITKIIEKVGASSIKEMGKVMGVASKDLAGKADGKEISDIVKKILSQ